MNITEMKKVLMLARKQLENAPKGTLWTSKTTGRVQYFNHDGEKRYISKEEAKPLALKKYNELIVKELPKHISNLEQYQLLSKNDFLQELLEKLPEAVRVLVEPYEKTYAQYGEEWVKKDFRTKGIRPETKSYKTENGEFVRSKSELIIANKLKSMGLYYRYECAKQIKDFGVIYPDFTVLNPKDKKEVIIEHFGMMDNPEYIENFIKKLKTYDLAGIYPGYGLICFFETKQTPLDIEYVEKMLSYFF